MTSPWSLAKKYGHRYRPGLGLQHLWGGHSSTHLLSTCCVLGPTVLHPGQYDRGQDRQRPPGRAVVTEPGRRCTPLPGNDVCSERTRGKVRGESSGEDTPRSRTPSLLGEETRPPCWFTRRPCVCALINSVAYYRASIWLGSGDTSWRTCFLVTTGLFTLISVHVLHPMSGMPCLAPCYLAGFY